MIRYILKRLIYAIPILVGVNLITFFLFFVVNTPDDVARLHLGNKRVTQEQIVQWKDERGYNKPLLYNEMEKGFNAFTNTIFYEKSFKLFLFDFGNSDSGRNIGYDIKQRMWPSLAIAIPSFMSIADKARSAAAANTVAQVAKECAVKITNDPDTTQTFSAVSLDGYDSFTVNSSTTACSDTGLIVATSADTGKYPTFTYNIATGEKTCSATTTDSQKLGCQSSKW